jgi:hypothetical protein
MTEGDHEVMRWEGRRRGGRTDIGEFNFIVKCLDCS